MLLKKKKIQYSSKKTGGPTNCPQGKMLKKAYIRKAYVKKNGTRSCQKNLYHRDA